ncbi:unnamed protein product [Prorocentrum cordatum]|uniref:RanBP2-type domain-containing protein n=1 Tax=Prorocentrum cordatum TaxID=2364126 RepID=A0ABN9P6J7_9DINO|nr:unnamed protein product [Polarella glacialis]
MHPGDWRCHSCNELQFSNRSTCRQCGANKPLFQVDWSTPAGKQEHWSTGGGSSHKEDTSWQEWQQWGEASEWGAANAQSAAGRPGAQASLPKAATPHQAKVAEKLFGQLAPDGDKKAQISLCMGAFQDLIKATVPNGENTEIVEKVKGLIGEVNDVLKEDKSAKHAFAMQISKHPWFLNVGHEVRYRPSANLIEISRVQGAHLKGKGKDGKGSWPQPPPAASSAPGAQTSWMGLKRTAEQAGLRGL